MAGDWIKVEHATIDKPEVLRMAETLNTSADDVVGKLIRVWTWFDVQSLDGNAGSVTGVTLMKFIDRLVSSQGFASCMKKEGWLTDDGMPNFDRHNGESAKKRALNNKRQKRFRNAPNVTDALPEKRREEKIETLRVVSDTFARFWQTWPSSPRKVAKAKCEQIWTRRKLGTLVDQIISHVAGMKESQQWRGGYEPSPVTYLNQSRWEDGSAPSPGGGERRLAT